VPVCGVDGFLSIVVAGGPGATTVAAYEGAEAGAFGAGQDPTLLRDRGGHSILSRVFAASLERCAVRLRLRRMVPGRIVVALALDRSDRREAECIGNGDAGQERDDGRENGSPEPGSE